VEGYATLVASSSTEQAGAAAQRNLRTPRNVTNRTAIKISKSASLNFELTQLSADRACVSQWLDQCSVIRAAFACSATGNRAHKNLNALEISHNTR
jgi:hypothetical protein